MARKKKAKALFELLGEDKEKAGTKLDVPGWFRKRQPASSAPPQGEESEPVTESPDETVAAASQPAPPPLPSARPSPRHTPTPPREPVFSTGDGRLRISLNTVAAAAILTGLVVLLIVAFVIGRGSAPEQAVAQGEGLKAPYRPDVAKVGAPGGGSIAPVPGASTTRREDRPLPPDDTARTPGQLYLVIQSGCTLEQAVDIQRFLRRNNVAATKHRTSTSKYMVKDLRPFASRDSAAAKQYVAHIEALGQKYKRQKNGLYDFRQPWWVLKKK